LSVKNLSSYTQYAKYAKYLPDKKRREIWSEMVDRMFDMHKEKYKDVMEDIQEEFDFAKNMVLKKRILGSQRALQFGGEPILSKNARIYNCCASYVDRVEFFQQCILLLLFGCGVGLSIQKHHVEKLPKVSKRDKGKKKFVIPDSIEGWADAIGVLMSSYFNSKVTFPEYKGYEVEFDYSKIRPMGAPISSGSKAPGPGPLKRAIDNIVELMNSLLGENQTFKLKPIHVYDMTAHISDAVLSGGIRRCLISESEILMFDGSYKKIKDVVVGDKIIFNKKEYPITEKFDNGIQELVKIHTDEGYQISTPNHRWLVFDYQDENIKYIEASEIEKIPLNYGFVQEL